MKKLYYIFSLTFASMFLLTSCQEDDHELGRMLDKSEIDFEVVQDYSVDAGGNVVILRNLTPETVAMWDYGSGQSTRTVDTIHLAFAGQHEVKFSALTAGGIVTMDPVIIEVTEDDLDFDPLWYVLSGGPSQEKSWVLDMDAQYFVGPMYFYGTDNGWLAGGGAWDGGATGCYGDDCWNWSPVYAENTWLFPDGDYGTMTFSLKGGTYFHASKPMEGGIEENGTYALNVANKTLTINGGSILRGYKGDNAGLAGISDWTNYTVFSLTENSMQLGVIRDKDIDGEGPAMLVYNFISKEFRDGVEEPEEPEQPDPNFGHGDQMEILTNNATRTWKLDTETPFNWSNLEGALSNPWHTRADYPDWGGVLFTDDDVQNIDDASIAFSNDGSVVVTQDNGIIEEGTYTIDEETNLITFIDIAPSIRITDRSEEEFIATTTADNQWKIVTVERDESNEVIGIWLGKRDPAKAEYMVFHFIPQI